MTRLANDEDAGRLASGPIEARIVAYADKRAGQRLQSMDERFASWRRRYPSGPADPPPGASEHPRGKRAWDDETAERVVDRARALEREICGLAGVEPHEVRRLTWSRRALREAAA